MEGSTEGFNRNDLYASLIEKFGTAEGSVRLSLLKALLRELAPERNIEQAAGVLPWLSGEDEGEVPEPAAKLCLASLTNLVPDANLQAVGERVLAQGLSPPPPAGEQPSSRGASRGEGAAAAAGGTSRPSSSSTGVEGGGGMDGGGGEGEGEGASSQSAAELYSSGGDEGEGAAAAAAEGSVGVDEEEETAGDAGPSLEYEHPAGCRVFLESEVVPLLRQGLLELLNAYETNRVREASGRDWDTEHELVEVDRQQQTRTAQYLPSGWKPFSPLRWLGEWLHANNPRPNSELDFGHSYSDYTLEEKAALIFSALDAAQAGVVERFALADTAQQLLPDRTAAEVEALLAELGAGQGAEAAAEGASVDLQLFAHTIAAVAKREAGEQRLDAAVLHTLGPHGLLPHCVRKSDKFGIVFLMLDRMSTGTVHGDDVAALIRRVDASKVDEALAAVGADASSRLSRDSFVSALSVLFVDATDEEALDAAVLELLDRPLVAPSMPASPRNPIEDVEPPALADYVRGLPTFSAADMIAVGDVVDRVSAGARYSSTGTPASLALGHGDENALVLLDVREEEEVAVSTIPSSLHMPAVADPKAPHGWSIPGDLKHLVALVTAALAAPSEAASDRPTSAKPKAPPPGSTTGASTHVTVVVFCSTGERSGAVAPQVARALAQHLPDVSVKALCGGIISYYNCGGSVRDPQGLVVQSVHPGQPAFKAFVSRPSKFKF